MTLIAGCKIMGDDVDSSFSGNGSAQNRSVPTIWGTPSKFVLVGSNYVFQPEAEDPDGDILEFAIENRPAWAFFDPATGTLQGVPADEDVGLHSNIVISVSDSESVVSLASFTISVRQSAAPPDDDTPDPTDTPDPAGSSSPPTISGAPNTSAVVDQQYVFKPQSSDADGDELSFSVVNKPSWANFNTTTGRLGGYPESSDIGTSEPIEISVTDGDHIAALKPFTITVEPVGTATLTLAWNPPTENADGSPLNDLAGYRIHYGTASREYTKTIEISSGITSYVIDGLSPGRYFLAMTSINSQELESDYSREIEVDTGS